MKELPHRYAARASGHASGDLELSGPRLPALASAPPEEFGGPGDRWSPETLLPAALAGCFVLTFRAIARRSNLEWTALACEAEGTLERVDRITRFTEFTLHARLRLPASAPVEMARRLLDKAEQACLISTSLLAPVHLDAEIDVESVDTAAIAAEA